MDHLDFRILNEKCSTCVDYFICASICSSVKMKINIIRSHGGVVLRAELRTGKVSVNDDAAMSLEMAAVMASFHVLCGTTDLTLFAEGLVCAPLLSLGLSCQKLDNQVFKDLPPPPSPLRVLHFRNQLLCCEKAQSVRGGSL